MLDIEQTPAEQLRKSIYSEVSNPEHKKIWLDKISDTFGPENFAYILMSLSTAIWPLAFLYTNENNFSIYQTGLVRGIAVIFLNVFVTRLYKIDMTFQNPKNFKILFFRNLIITIQGLVYTIVQFYLPQPIILTINATGPLFIFVMDYKINGVVISVNQMKGVALGIIGVLLTVNGDMIIRLFNPNYSPTSDFQYLSSSPLIKLGFSLLFVLAQLGWAYAQIITKELTGVNSIQINIHLGIFIILSTGLIYPSQVIEQVSIYKLIISIFVSGFVMAISQILFIGAATMTKNTGVTTMFVFVGVIVGYLISVFRYNQSVNLICIIGTVLIIFGLAKVVLK